MAELTPSELFDPATLLAFARRTAPEGILSIYVAADNGADPGLRGAAIDIGNRLSELERNIAAEDPRRAKALREAIDRLAPEIDRLTTPYESGRGRALFAPLDGDGEAVRFSSQMPLPNRVVLDESPFIHPLLELLDEGRPAGVVLVAQDEARVLEWTLGELTPVERLEPEVVQAPHERSGPVGSSPSSRTVTPRREQRQAREHDRTRRFLEQVEATAARLATERGWERLLVSGGPTLTEPLADGLAAAQDATVIRDTRVLIGLDDSRLATTVTERLHAQHDEHESQLVRDAREAALGAGTGAVGLSEVAAALNEGRVAHLVYDPEVRYRGSVGEDGLLHAAGEAPPGGEELVDEPRLTERLVERALETGARITPVEGAAAGALAEAKGIAALLRW